MPGAPVASDGSTYLVVYDVLGQRESTSQQLCSPMVSGKSYSFQVDIAFRAQGSFLSSAAGALEVWAGNSACTTDQLLFTSAVPGNDWKTQCVTFKAEQAFDCLLLQPAAASGITGVFVDNVVPVARCP